MSLNSIERTAKRAGVAATLVTLATLLLGLWRGTRRPAGRISGRQPRVLRRPLFYLVASAGYFGLCYLLWRPIRQTLSTPTRALAFALGTLLYVAGLALVLSGRLALGQMYNVSSSFGAQLYTGHRLITHGPFAFVRHPMYLGILLIGLGGLLLYRTWTFALILATFLGLPGRARHEEEALAAEFGEQWEAYRQRVPAWLPRLQRSYSRTRGTSWQYWRRRFRVGPSRGRQPY